jgi:hypothetical protein
MNGLLAFAVLVFAAATLTAYIVHEPDPAAPASRRRVKLVFAGFVLWGLGLRGLATEVAHPCAVDPSWLSVRGGLSGLWGCSPKLLSGRPVDLFVFIWLWAPILLAAGFWLRLLLRGARRPRSLPEGS